MILSFPNQPSFELAIRSGVVPREHVVSPAKAGWTDDGGLFIETKRRATVAFRKAIEPFEGEVVGKAPIPLNLSVATWLELLPLAPDEIRHADNAPILFELNSRDQLVEVAWEMLRLGNDRQSFRHLASPKEADRTLLLVYGPPYYSLLRALAGDEEAPSAFYQQTQRVWTQIGWRHPLGEQIEPAAGQSLLLRAPAQWEAIADAPYREIYEALEFQLPAGKVTLADAPLEARIQTPLSLKPGGSNQAAEFWALSGDGERQLDQFVQNADDELLDQLAFAVGRWNEETRVAVRVRPSRQAPPLVIEGVACRSYSGLDNLFVPCGWYVHPPLRRDAIADLLAPGQDEIVWLQPTENGGFVPCSLPDDAFRPLAEWVEYVVDSHSEAVSHWVQGTQFEFESFICSDDDTPGDSDPPDKQADGPDGFDESDLVFEAFEESNRPQRPRDSAAAQQAELDFSATTPLQINALQQRLNTLEQNFLELSSPLESPERTALWFQLANVHMAMNHRLDGLLCYSNAAWEDESLAIKGTGLWFSQPLGDQPPEDLLPLLERLDQGVGFQVEDAGELAVLLMWASFSPVRPEWVTSRLGIFVQRLEQFEKNLPLRTMWLAWRALVKLSQGDLLALARARDRALERLFQSGLKPELDLPTFLRVAGQGDSSRLRSVRDALPDIARDIAAWIDQSPGESPYTQCYCSLAVAWAWGRLGETTKARELRDRTLADPANRPVDSDHLHEWLCDAWSYRIEQAIMGDSAHLQWSPDLAQRRADENYIDTLTQYNLNRFLYTSEILDPHESVSHFARGGYSANVSSLVNLTDPVEIRKETIRRIHETQPDSLSAAHGENLTAGLQKSPMVGEKFAIELLNRAAEYCGETSETAKRATVLCAAFRVAAHFGLSDHVDHFVQTFRNSLEELVAHYLKLNRKNAYAGNDHFQIVEVENLFREIFRGFRKFGLRDEMSRCLETIREVAAAPENMPHPPREGYRLEFEEENRAKQLMLGQLEANGWLLLGRVEEARAIIEQTREYLFGHREYVFDTTSQVYKSLRPAVRELVSAYVTTLGQTPIEIGLPFFREIFDTSRQRLIPIFDEFATSSHCVISQLAVVESVLVAIVSEDFTLNQESRRLLEEDEFLVRRRIHADAAAIES